MTRHTDDLLDGTHDPAIHSWVESANDPATDFPPQNLPFGRFRVKGDTEWRMGVAIGDQVLDLRAAGLVDHADMQRLMALSVPARRNLRHAISNGLRSGSVHQADWQHAQHPADAVVLGTPCPIGNYTDFYVGIHHATAVGKLFRPDNPLLPNYHWIPIGYHGRWGNSGQAKTHRAWRRRSDWTTRSNWACSLANRMWLVSRSRWHLRKTMCSAWPCSTTGAPGMCRPGNTSHWAPSCRRISPARCRRGS
jgi:hypothetical protein